MRRPTGHPTWHRLAACLAALVVAPGVASAQVGGPGFLFGTPRVQLELHTGYSVARAGSQIYSFVTDSLTLNKSAFNSFIIGGDLSVRLTNRLDAGLDLTYAGGSRPSQERNWVDQNNLPIQQTTSFYRMPVTARLKWYLLPQGVSVARFAWVPTTWSPYIGAGAGVMWYKFDQSGDFVDAQTLNVFSDQFHSSGATPTVDVFGGTDVSLNKSLVLTAEARYDWANAPMGPDYVGFNRIDLSGFLMSVGIGVRF